jgi:hypothetical protein
MQNSQLSQEQLLDTFSSYCNEGKYYDAFALALDNYETVPLFNEMMTDEDKPNDMIGLFLLFCKELDRDRAIKYATILIDFYKSKNINEKIIELSYHFTVYFAEPLANTPAQLIMKDGIKAVIDMLDNITDTAPNEKMMVCICANMLCFPSFCKDNDFSLPLIKKLTAHYDTNYKARRYVIACFLPSIKRGLEALEERYLSYSDVAALRMIDSDEFAKYIENGRTYLDLIFVDGYPQLDSENPYGVVQNRTKENEYIDMIKEQELLRFAILSLPEDIDELPDELEARHNRMLEYFLEMDIADSNLELTRVIHLVSGFAMCRYVDMDYTLEALAVLAPKLLNHEIDDFTYTGTIVNMQTALMELSEVYELTGDDYARYSAYLKYLALSNVYFKRICFEEGLAGFMDSVKSDYSTHHSIVSKAIKVALDNKFSLNQMYFEMSQRKNLLYLGEMWQKQGVSAIEIKKLLDREFTFADIQQALGDGRTLLDFFYLRINTGDDRPAANFDRSFVDDIRHFGCFVFVVRSDSETRLELVDLGTQLAENIYGDEDTFDYFADITEYILHGVKPPQTLLVCVDGDLNQVSFAALPLLAGYVTDHYAVRNIASVFDVVYPHRKKEIKTALVVSAPDYGASKEQPPKWKPLLMSRKEGDFITEIMSGDHFISVDRIGGNEATADNITAALASQSYNTVHISTHGYFADRNVYMVTAGANSSDSNTVISDDDVGAFSLEDTSFVSLALCFGGKQNHVLQDSLSGFIKACLLAGANTIIAPTAPIPDLATAIFMSEFYSRYLSAYETESAEVSMQKTIVVMRNMKKDELLEKYDIEVDEEYPFSDVRHWGNWVCFSAEEVRGR